MYMVFKTTFNTSVPKKKDFPCYPSSILKTDLHHLNQSLWESFKILKKIRGCEHHSYFCPQELYTRMVWISRW